MRASEIICDYPITFLMDVIKSWTYNSTYVRQCQEEGGIEMQNAKCKMQNEGGGRRLTDIFGGVRCGGTIGGLPRPAGLAMTDNFALCILHFALKTWGGFMRVNAYPVRGGCVWGFTDEQGALPWGWCPGCGMEIWRKGSNLCEKCAEKEENRWIKENSSPFTDPL